MINKKERFILGLSVFVILVSLNLISAYTYTYSGGGSSGYGFDIRQGSQTFINFVVDWAEPFLQALFGGQDYTGALLFERFLMFVLLLSMVYISLKQVSFFEDQKRILIVVSIIVPLLAVRFISFEWINTIIMQYQVLGIAVLGLLPFIIYLFFLHSASDSAVVRKIGWIFFIVIYLGLWITNESDSYGSVYFWTMVIALVFLLFDGTIHRAFDKQKWKEADRSGIASSLAYIAQQIERMEDAKGIDERIRKKELKKLYSRRSYLQKQMS